MSAFWIALQGYGIGLAVFFAAIAFAVFVDRIDKAISGRLYARAIRRLTRGAVR